MPKMKTSATDHSAHGHVRNGISARKRLSRKNSPSQTRIPKMTGKLVLNAGLSARTLAAVAPPK